MISDPARSAWLSSVTRYILAYDRSLKRQLS
jgi:hypothetical protein